MNSLHYRGTNRKFLKQLLQNSPCDIFVLTLKHLLNLKQRFEIAVLSLAFSPFYTKVLNDGSD